MNCKCRIVEKQSHAREVASSRIQQTEFMYVHNVWKKIYAIRDKTISQLVIQNVFQIFI